MRKFLTILVSLWLIETKLDSLLPKCLLNVSHSLFLSVLGSPLQDRKPGRLASLCFMTGASRKDFFFFRDTFTVIWVLSIVDVVVIQAILFKPPPEIKVLDDERWYEHGVLRVDGKRTVIWRHQPIDSSQPRCIPHFFQTSWIVEVGIRQRNSVAYLFSGVIRGQ